MVMAQIPSTQYVAHEFVRQYYTVLHKDPSQLHRFYTRESRLTHGVSPNAKSEDPVCGQEAINEKISQLHFRSCHARIRSVDSHQTIGGGVVIQVTGELSNAGMAMRKFMQTFVLAQQEPKKYHVFNDIFRYQDETFEDTENDGTANETAESENGYGVQESTQATQVLNEADQNVPSEADIMSHIVNGEDKLYCDIEKEDEDEELDDTFKIQPTDQDYIEKNAGEDDEEEDEEDDEEEEFSTPVQTPATESAKTISPENPEDDGTEFKEYEDVKVEETVVDEKNSETDSAPDKPPKAVTWAALAKKNTPSPLATPPSGSPNLNNKSQQQIPKKENRPAQKKREEPAPVARKEQTEEPKRRSNPDSHQIFIGNLPNIITEKDVREAFNEFGNIVEVRLNAKNFGFVAFDGPDPPNTILQKKQTIQIHGHTINTEVKRSVSGNRGNAGRDSGGGFRRSDRDSNRNRGDMSKNSGRSGGGSGGGGSGQNRLSGKNSQHSQKQRNNDDSKSDKNKDSKTQKDQRQSRR